MPRWKSSKWVVVLPVLVTPIVWCGCCPTSLTLFEWNYRYRIHAGMTLEEAESILGPGSKRQSPPRTADSPVTQGDEFYVWKGGDGILVGGLEIWVGVREGRFVTRGSAF